MGWMDEYQQVEDRLREFLDRFRAGRVITHMVSDPDKTEPGDVILFRAELYRGDELRDTPPAASGYAHQRILSEPPPGKDGKPNRHSPEWTSPWETAETSAVGRALANAGFSPKGKRPSFEEIRKADVAASASPVPQPQGENAPTRGATGESSEGVSGGEYGEGSTPAPPSDAIDTTDLIALLGEVGGSEVKAINAINKAMHTAYKPSDLQTLEPEDWKAGFQQVRGN